MTSRIKKEVLVILIILLPVVCITNTWALDYRINVACENGVCMKGQTAEWNITITNNGDKTLDIVGIELIDFFNHTIIASWNTTYEPIISQIDDVFRVYAGESGTKNITGKLPAPNDNKALVYYLCFENTVRAPEFEKYSIYTKRVCYDYTYEKMPLIECIDNSLCSFKEYCSNELCKKLVCKDCQYPEAHKCVNFECCYNSTCQNDQFCMGNLCLNLNCSTNEQPINHSCQPLNCSREEMYVDHTCLTLNCSEEESYVNHTCVNLSCKEDEFFYNHSCKILDCAFDEGLFNHTCVPLNCLFNETAVKHMCKPLDCRFFERKIAHQCVPDKPLIFKLSIESTVILIAILILIIDIRRYEAKKHLKKSKKKPIVKNTPGELPSLKDSQKKGAKKFQNSKI
jgi:hypothetical protein